MRVEFRFTSYGSSRDPSRHSWIDSMCGTSASDSARAIIAVMRPGRVTRKAMVSGLWQSTHDTGWACPISCTSSFSSS